MAIAILWILGSLVLFSAGEAGSKLWVASGRWEWAASTIVLYAVGSAMWLPAIKRTNHLASLGSLWNAGAMITTVLMGTLVFHEQVTPRQWIGIGFGFVACFLLGEQPS